jgi:4-amino-4-deoxy-L-arabinose transferase-like glycosyltransferase
MARRIPLTDQPDVQLLHRRAPLALAERIQTALRAEQLLLALLGCYLVVGLAASLFIPPWQAPDEPPHFAYVRSLQLGVSGDTPDTQRPIIASLYNFRFWDYRGAPAPAQVPASFTAPSLSLFPQIEKTPFYYWLGAHVASWTDDLILQLYSVRWLSVLLSMLAIPLIYATAREILPAERAGMALAAAALVAFLPMYEYIGAAVNPDNLGAPLAAAAILLAVRALRGKQPIAASVGAVLLAALAFWARRSTIVIVPWSLLVAAVCALGWVRRRYSRAALLALVATGLALILAAVVWPSDRAAAWRAVGGDWGATRSDQSAFEGTHSLRIVRSAQTPEALLVQSLPPPRVREVLGRTVLLDAMVRSAGTPTRGALALSVRGGHSASTPFMATGDWQHVALSYVVPTNTLNLDVILIAAGTGELLFDRVQLLAGGTATPATIISNSGGEVVLSWWQQRFQQNQAVQYLTRIIQSARDGVYGSPQALALYPWFLYHMFSSLYGRFGWMNFGLSDQLYLAIGLVCVGLLCGLARVGRRAGGLVPGQRHAITWLALLVVMAVATLLLDYTPYLYTSTYPQGRYLFPVLAPIAALLVSGFAQLLPARYERQGLLSALALLIALDVWSWAGVIVPYFYR